MDKAANTGVEPVFGKQVGSFFYWHHLLTSSQPEFIQKLVIEAEQLAGVVAGEHYNVLKYPQSSNTLSLLWYPGFFDDPFPALSWSWIVDFLHQSSKYRNYSESLNPPIIHRKELFLPANHPRLEEYCALTESAEKLGLFNNSSRIGFRQAWDSLISESGFFLEGHTLSPIGNAEEGTAHVSGKYNADLDVLRHRTALTRYNLSAPMQALARFGFLDGQKTVFDYGCGKGDDIRNLLANNIPVSGWDPHFAPGALQQPADIVNIGFVINVIENIDERLSALTCAFSLSKELLVISAMLYNQNSFKGQPYQDGVLTTRYTFQKYYSQSELKEYIDESLGVESIPVGPGIFFVFRDVEAEQRFLLGRQRSRSNFLRLTKREVPNPRISVRSQKYQSRIVAVTRLRERWLTLGRPPHKSEVEDLVEIHENFGTLGKALRFFQDETDPDQLEQAKKIRKNDLLVYFALHTFSQRKSYSHFDMSLKLDIKTFFGDYNQALEQGRALLFCLTDTKSIESECKAASERGVGYYDDEHALHLPSNQVDRLSPLLRIYIGCAAILYGDISNSDIVKIHIGSGKLSLMKYDDFHGSPLPRLQERVKIKFRSLDFDCFRYGDEHEPTYLYLKSRYMNEDLVGYAEQVEFDEQLTSLGLFDFSGYGPGPRRFNEILTNARWEIDGWNLIRSRELPNIDAHCGRYFTYRAITECGDTWNHLRIDNMPQQADSYTALHDLAVNIIDPVIDYFGMIRLTYGFCSATLAKKIPGRIAPKLDQHAAHELNRIKKPICPRLGAAVDFIVEDEDMLEVAEWVVKHTKFDRIYFYGSDKPIHVSYGPEKKSEFIEMRIGRSGRLIPSRRRIK